MSTGLIAWAASIRVPQLEPMWLEDSFLAGLSDKACRRLERHGSGLGRFGFVDNGDVATRQQIVARDAPAVVVLRGAVKVFYARGDGRKALVDIAGPGDLLVPEPFVSGMALPMSVSWTDESLLLVVPRRAFLDLLAADQEIRQAFMLVIALRAQAFTRQRGHAARPTEQRVWSLLVDLGRRHGIGRGERVVLNIGLTQPDLAAAVDATISAVEGAMRKLRKLGKISTGYASVQLNELPSDEELEQSFADWGRQLVD
jgi:CRP/FNR family transcriptional regulator, cyclic AMP receptor protein